MNVKIDLSSTLLETGRLILRPYRETDVGDVFQYVSVEGVGEMAGWRHHESMEKTSRIIRMFIDRKTELAIQCKQTGRVIGSIGLSESWAGEEEPYKDRKVAELAYSLAKDCWGQGLMPEAVKAVILYCFEELGLDALTCEHFATNPQSKRVIEKCGFTFAGQDEHYSQELEQNFENLKYILLRENAPGRA